MAALASISAELKPLLRAMSDAAYKRDHYAVMQPYEELKASPAHTRLAELARDHRAELEELHAREAEVDVLQPSYLLTRHAKAAATDPDDFIKYLMAVIRRVEEGVGQATLSFLLQYPDETEHAEGIVEDYEQQFFTSTFLRAIPRPSNSASDLITVAQIHDGGFDADVISAALLKHPPASSEELAELVRFTRSIGLSITVAAGENLERSFERCMRQESAQSVFERMIATGLPPFSTRLFALLFNASKTFAPGSRGVLDYYELMLDYGITPEPSTWRILCKQCSGYACDHFTLRQKSTTAPIPAPTTTTSTSASSTTAGGASAGAAVGAHRESRRKDERTYYLERLRELVSATKPNPVPLMEALKLVHRAQVEGTSLHGDNLLPVALLHDCCKGTTRQADLMWPFEKSQACQPGKVQLPREVLRSLPSQGTPHHQDPHHHPDEDAGAPALVQHNAFDFHLDGAVGELLEDGSPPQNHDEWEGGSSGTSNPDRSPLLPRETTTHTNESSSPNASNHNRGGNAAPQDASSAPARRPAGIASPGEEADYVLKVLAQFGAMAESGLIQSIFFANNTTNNDEVASEVAQAVIRFLVESSRESRGVGVSPILCSDCRRLMHYLVRLPKPNPGPLRLMRTIVLQYYEYTHEYGTDWRSTVPAGQDHNNNLRTVFPFLSTAMRGSSLEAALGIFTLGLVMSTEAVPTRAIESLQIMRTKASHRSQHHPVLVALEQCRWVRAAVLEHPSLVPQVDRSRSNPDLGSAEKDSAEDGMPVGHEASVLEVSGRSSSTPVYTLYHYLYSILRELEVGREIAEWYKIQLREEQKHVVAHKAG